MGFFTNLITGGDSPNARALKWAMDKLKKARQRRDENAEAAVREAQAEVREALEAQKDEEKNG